MRFLKFLQRFSQKEPEKPRSMTIDELRSWLNKKENDSLENIKLQLSSLNTKIDEEKNKAKENLNLLLTATLINEKIPEREKHFMDGNRKAYAQKIDDFLNKFNIPEDSVSEEFFLTLENEFNHLGENTSRNYQILQHFLSDYSRSIVGNIKRLYELLKEAQDLVKASKIKEIDEIRTYLENIELENQHKKERKQQLEASQINKTIIQNNQKLYTKKIHEIKNSDKYLAYIDLIKQKETSIIQKNETVTRFLNHFSSIDVALRKYERITLDNSIVQSYINNPVHAIHSDTNLKILEIIPKMKNSIEQDTLDLKESKKRKILEECELFTPDFFTNFIEKNKALTRKIEQIQSTLTKETIAQKIKILEKKVQEHENALRTEEETIAILKNESKLNFSTNSKHDVEHKIKNHFGKIIDLILPVQ